MKASVGLGMAAVVLTLAGCGEGDPPVADPPPSTSPTTPTDASSSTTAAALGPEQTVRAWVRAYNKLSKTGDSTDMTQLTDPRCAMCGSLTGSLQDVLDRGGAYRAGEWVVVRAAVARTRGRKAVVDAAIHAKGGSVRQAAGQQFKSFSSDNFILQFTVLSRQDGATQVVDLVGLQ